MKKQWTPYGLEKSATSLSSLDGNDFQFFLFGRNFWDNEEGFWFEGILKFLNRQKNFEDTEKMMMMMFGSLVKEQT